MVTLPLPLIDRAEGVRTGAVEGQRAVVGHAGGAVDRARDAAGADLQRAAADGGRAGVGVGPGQDQRAGCR